ncbi:MAG: ABC transporter ATP-binding protein [Christensenellales bacterium]|jgi:ABC-2 type transport system ATP-binding protein
MSTILEAANVSIRYMLGDFRDIGLKEYIIRRLTGKYHVEEFWAVKDVSFTLDAGDMLGIVGANGAGKSTLLKAVSGIMIPTRGNIRAEGSVVSLLELASGFDPDMTVKENAYLRGAILGYTRKFMNEKYDEIIAFSELENYQERQFKQLSSGMKSRLAFSIASVVEPDILVLDEVLSVGDGAFQDKSAAKMREIISRGSATILVSHSMKAVQQMCDKVMWMDRGKKIAYGPVEPMCALYSEYLSSLRIPAREELRAAGVEA